MMKKVFRKKFLSSMILIQVIIFLCSLSMTQVNAVGVYIDFDEFPVTGENEIPGDGGGWKYSSHITDTGHTFYGSCGYWNTENGTKSINDVHDYFSLSNLSVYNAPGMGYETYQFLEIDDKVAHSGNSFKITVTGGKKHNNENILTSYGLQLHSKEEYLEYLTNGESPVDSSVQVGHPYMYFMHENISGTGQDQPIDRAIGANRLSFYVYLPEAIEGYPNPSGPANTFATGPFNHVPHEDVLPPDHSDYTSGDTYGGHWYHNFYTGGGGWTHVVQDAHPHHNNAMYNIDKYPYPSRSMRDLGPEYFNTLYRFYLAIYPYTGISVPKYSVWLDTMEFINDPEPQNNETINSPSILMKSDKTFEIGFNDKYKPSTGLSYSTYEVRYSFSQITNANWDSATKVHMLGDSRWSQLHENADGLMRKVNSYSVGMWAPFKLAIPEDEALLTPGNKIYFAIKDVSQSTADPLDPIQVGWGRDYRNTPEKFDFEGDAPALPLIKRIDYYIAENNSSSEIRADVDQNGTVNSTDAMLTLRSSLGLDMSSTNWVDSTTTGDVNCDDVSNSTDAMLILRKSLGLDMGSTGWCIN